MSRASIGTTVQKPLRLIISSPFRLANPSINAHAWSRSYFTPTKRPPSFGPIWSFFKQGTPSVIQVGASASCK